MKARTDQARTVIIGEARSPVGVSLGLRLIGDEEVATITLTQHDKTVTLYVADQAHAAQIAAAIQGHPPLAADAPRVEAKATAMTDYQLVPFPPTAEMVSAAEDAYMPFGDMELALRMAILAAPAVQGEPATYLRKDQLESLVVDLPPLPQEAEARSMHYACRRALERVGVRVNIAPQPAEQQAEPDVAGLVAKMEILIAAGNRLNANAEECNYDDGTAEVAGSEYWCEFRDALDAARAAIAVHRKGGEA